MTVNLAEDVGYDRCRGFAPMWWIRPFFQAQAIIVVVTITMTMANDRDWQNDFEGNFGSLCDYDNDHDLKYNYYILVILGVIFVQL